MKPHFFRLHVVLTYKTSNLVSTSKIRRGTVLHRLNIFVIFENVFVRLQDETWFSWSKKHVCITCTVFICCHDLYSVVTMYIHTQQMVDTMANVEWKCKCLIKMYTIGSVQYKSIHTEHITSLSNDLSMVQHQSIETSWNMWNKMTEKHTKKSKELFKELTVD